MQQAVNHWVMVEKIGERRSTILGPDGKPHEQAEAYCKVLNAGPHAKIEEAGYGIGDIIAGPRILWIPGLPKNVGFMSAGDVYYKMDALPEGVTPLDAVTTIDDFVNPGLGKMLQDLKPVDPSEGGVKEVDNG